MVPETGIVVSMADPNHRDREVRGRVEHHIHRGELNAANGVIADYREEIEQRTIAGLSPVSSAGMAAATAWREQAVRNVAREASSAWTIPTRSGPSRRLSCIVRSSSPTRPDAGRRWPEHRRPDCLFAEAGSGALASTRLTRAARLISWVLRALLGL